MFIISGKLFLKNFRAHSYENLLQLRSSYIIFEVKNRVQISIKPYGENSQIPFLKVLKYN